MATLGIHKDFLLEFARLEKSVQKRVHEVFGKFEQHHHAGLHLEKLAKARDPRIRTIRVTQFWRGVVLAPETGDSFLLLKVLPHDDAIDWALKHRATVNSATLGIELRNDVALERATAGVRQLAGEGGKFAKQPLFPGVSDADLQRLGVDVELLPLVRALSDEAQLDALHKVMPEQQFDVLAGLAAGTSVDDVWREVVLVQRDSPATDVSVSQQVSTAHVVEQSAGPHDELSEAMARSQGRIALVSGPDELMDILGRPFDAWRIFLHPSQRKVAYRRSYKGPARVTGGPGTGKTVVALHRALHLARRLPADAPDGSILLTTYTKDLTADLQRSLGLLIPDEGLRAKVRVAHVDVLANEVVRKGRGAHLKIVHNHQDITARWNRMARRLKIEFADVFLDQEWRHVVLAQDLRAPEAYLKASRTGRGTALSPLKRAQVWRAIEAFTKELRDAGEWTFLQVCAAAADLMAKRDEAPYRHVIVDEAQDLHPAQWRFLRALVAPGPDDLFIAGDTYQRIYGNKVSLRSLGISVTGRSTRLRINYRTTKEILAWSTALLTGESLAAVDDMDGGNESLSGYRSTFHGAVPRTSGSPSKAAEIERLIAVVREWTEAGVAPEEIGVAVRFIQLGKDIALALEGAGLSAKVLGTAPRTGGAGGSGGVRIGTMHRMKGLEFRCVAVCGVSDGVVPMRNAVTPVERDPQQHQEDLLGELSLLFVACTRAREALSVSWHGAPSPFLAAALD
ncbi:UvrD-helicase domain-containing protein [Streptomyces sp. NPDC051561]|uniref:UvrD-helicase domain-containing protein n=1 Tax=Streptomyces sp. NPDC051561 TaxID=3365658 RepID=UPI00379D3655